MPAPRPPAQSRARKSTVPDPDLYGDDQDPSSDDHPPPPKRAKPAPPSSKQLSRRGSKGPQPVRGTVIADNGRRRSSRLSNEGPPADPDDNSPAAAESSSSRARNTSTSAPARKPKPVTKAKKRPHRDDRSSSDPGDDADEPELPPAPAPARSKSSAKRPRVAPDDDSDAHQASSSRGAGAAPVASGSGGTAPAPAPARRGFVPRAVADLAQRVNKPPPTYAAALVDDDADSADGAADPFPFTTNPPTPHAKKKVQGAGGTKAATAAKGKGKAPRAVRPVSPRSASDAEDDNAAGSDSDVTPDSAALPPSHAATTSTSSRRARPAATPPRAQGRHPLPHDADGRASVHVHETPVQVKNIAFRAGAGPGTPATAQRTMTGSGGGGSARRNSVRGSATRGSSIGGGFDAVPHPQVADDKLYRSTDASDPLAKRLRALLSWASQRTRGRVLAPSGLGDKGEGDEVERAAREIVDGWVEDVCRLKVDTSVPFSEPSASQDPATLPPHPQNEANAVRLGELEAAYAAIAQEQARRHALEPTYQAFFDRRSAAHDTALAPQRAWDDPVKMARTLDTSSTSLAAVDPPLSALPLSSLADARALGQRVLAGALALPVSASASPSPATDRPEIQHALVGTVQLAHAAHRLEGFVRAASAYVRHRGRETHAVLGQLGGSAVVPGSAAAGGEGAGLAAALVGGAAGAGGAAATGGAGVDARDLLRAIAGADVARR
ncbi:hypothetical protein JCM8208_006633 [Rhodotorula glutinis]